MMRRRALLGGSMALAAAGFAPSLLAASKPPVVLFVCPAGTAKSAIARELFRRRAEERGIAATAFSRGLQIEDHVSAPLRQRLDAEAIDTRRDGFAVLEPKDARRADIVVAFAPLPAGYRSPKLRDWSAVPSVNDDWASARADMDRRIEALLDSLAAAKGTKPR